MGARTEQHTEGNEVPGPGFYEIRNIPRGTDKKAPSFS